jgi:hypothetical protein
MIELNWYQPFYERTPRYFLRRSIVLEGKIAFLIPHTHWDRAWYLSFEEFRAGLIGLFDAIFRFIDNQANPPFFLDGQTIVIDDYLALRPEMEDRLKKAVDPGAEDTPRARSSGTVRVKQEHGPQGD